MTHVFCVRCNTAMLDSDGWKQDTVKIGYPFRTETVEVWICPKCKFNPRISQMSEPKPDLRLTLVYISAGLRAISVVADIPPDVKAYILRLADIADRSSGQPTTIDMASGYADESNPNSKYLVTCLSNGDYSETVTGFANVPRTCPYCNGSVSRLYLLPE